MDTILKSLELGYKEVKTVLEVWDRAIDYFREENKQLQMVSCFPSTPKKLAITVAYFIGGASLFAFGLHLSHVNAAPQQARIKARNDFVRERLRKKYGDTSVQPK